MTKRLSSLLLIMLAVIAAVPFAKADDKVQYVNVDLNAIEVDVTMNPQKYQQLLNRFIDADTSLTPNEMATIYYGNAFTFDYDPDADFSEIRTLFEEEKYDDCVKAVLKELKSHPVALEPIMIGTVAASRSTTPEINSHYANLQNRYNLLSNLIASSGKAIKRSSPIYVTSYNDVDRVIYDLLGAYEIVGQSSIGELDAFKIRFKNSMNEYILYFNLVPYHRYKAQTGAAQ